jgi:RimJ/RimL family protein N-acetyltransferase
VRDDGFTRLRLPALHANMAHDHDASRRVAERIGMTFVRTFDNPRNRGIRTLIYRMAAPDAGAV